MINVLFSNVNVNQVETVWYWRSNETQIIVRPTLENVSCSRKNEKQTRLLYFTSCWKYRQTFLDRATYTVYTITIFRLACPAYRSQLLTPVLCIIKNPIGKSQCTCRFCQFDGRLRLSMDGKRLNTPLIGTTVFVVGIYDNQHASIVSQT